MSDIRMTTEVLPREGLPLVAVVDDCGVERRLTCRLAAQCGLGAMCFVDGQELMEEVTDFLATGQKLPVFCDMLILDFDMPRKNGPDTVKAMRTAGFASLPIVVITSDACARRTEACMGSGANEVLLKPVTKQMIAQLRDKHLAHLSAVNSA